MPKGQPRTRSAYATPFSHQPGKSQDEMSYTVVDGSGKSKSIKGKNLRNIVGDEKANALKSATDSNPKTRGSEMGKAKAEHSFGPTNNPGTSERKAKAAKAKATVDREMDEVIDMVRSKKSAKRNDYGA